MSGFSPGQQVTLYWPDLTVIAQVTADGSGNATASFRTPLVALGTYTIRASDPAKTTATTLLRVIPRMNLSEFSGDPGKEFRVYFYGYAPGDQVEVRLYSLDGAAYQVIGTTTVAGNGRGTMLVTIPYGSEAGVHTIRGSVIDVGRSTSTSFTVTQAPFQLSLSKSSSKFNGQVDATMTGFAPNDTVTLWWPDGLMLGQGTTDGAGNAVITFRTPLYPLGNYLVTGTDSAGHIAGATLRVIPRIKLTEYSGETGSRIRVYFYGFSPGEQVEIKWYELDGTTFEVLKTVTIADNGRASTLIDIPDDAANGKHKIQGDVIGVSRSASDWYTVTGPGASENPTDDADAESNADRDGHAGAGRIADAGGLPDRGGAAGRAPTPVETSTPEPSPTEVPTNTPTPEPSPTPEPTTAQAAILRPVEYR